MVDRAKTGQAQVTFYRVLYRKIFIRAAPSTTSKTLDVLSKGEIVGVAHVSSNWAKLCEEELNYVLERADEAFVLIDGSELGLPLLLEKLPQDHPQVPPLRPWRLPHRLIAAAPCKTFGVTRPTCFGGEIWPHATSPEHYLCYWRAVEKRNSAGAVGWHGPAASQILRAAPATAARVLPRIATATLVRGVSARTAENFALYHRAVGFDLVYLYFDAPHEEPEAVAAAAAVKGTIVVECTDNFWKLQRTFNPFFTSGKNNGGVCSVQQFDAGDVMARQCAAVQDAIARARAARIEWLLHVDSDELWYSPIPAVQERGAGAFFAEVHPGIGQLVFHNHEAVPPSPKPRHATASQQMPESDHDHVVVDASSVCAFEQVHLFKPNEAFTRATHVNQQRREEAEKLQNQILTCRSIVDNTNEEVDDSEDGEQHTTKKPQDEPQDNFDKVVYQLYLGRTRRQAANAKHDPVAAAWEAKKQRQRKAREKRLKGHHKRRERRRKMRLSGVAEDVAHADAESDDSDYEARLEILKEQQSMALEFQYFHSHNIGKSAFRLSSIRSPVSGIHRAAWAGGDTNFVEGPGSPVILHYAACGFEAWKRKYQMLTTHPRFEGGKQASLGELTCRDEPPKQRTLAATFAAPDTTQPLDPDHLYGAHIVAANLIRSGKEDEARRVYERTICMPDMLPSLACHGLLLEVCYPRELLARCRREYKAIL